MLWADFLASTATNAVTCLTMLLRQSMIVAAGIVYIIDMIAFVIIIQGKILRDRNLFGTFRQAVLTIRASDSRIGLNQVGYLAYTSNSCGFNGLKCSISCVFSRTCATVDIPDRTRYVSKEAQKAIAQ